MSAKVAPWLTLALGSLVLMGPKCVETDTLLLLPTRLDGGQTMTTTTATTTGSIPPSVYCQDVNTAQLLIQNFAYNILCGCEESEGSTCTIPIGTEVVWIFADSDEHNVASAADVFPPSGERLAGRYAQRFDVPGAFQYLCTIHPRDMSGYTIVVKP